MRRSPASEIYPPRPSSTMAIDIKRRMSDNMGPNSDRNPGPSTKPLQLINKEDEGNKFFSRLLSKESSSIANSSFRVYYAGVAGAVPFVWESQPGTPKHTLFTDSISGLPPLTPPPSSFRSTASGGQQQPTKKSRRSGFLRRLLWKVGMMRRPLPVSSSSSSSLYGFVPIKPMDHRNRRSRRFPSQGSLDSINPFDYDEEEQEQVTAAGPVLCFGISRRNGAAPRGCSGW